MNCPICGSDNPDGAIFCQGCGLQLAASPALGQPPSRLLPLQDMHPRPPRLGRAIWIAAAVVILLTILSIAAVASVFHIFTNTQNPSGAVVSWMFSAGLGNPGGTADKTVAKVIGGETYTETKQWYSNFLDQYKGHTGVNLSNITRTPNIELDAAQKSAAVDAVALLEIGYEVTVTDYCYVHFWLTGLGHFDEEMTVGLLEVGHTWYVGYATNVVDLGNI